MSSKAPEKLFEKAAFGYRTEEVDRYVDQQSAQIRTLEAEKAELMEKMKILAEKVNEYRNEEGALRDALLGAQKMGNSIVSEAKTKADMMITDAKSRSEKMVYEAQKTADETISGIRSQVDREKMTLAKMEKAVADFKSKLLSIYKVHLNAITSLPDMEEEYEEFYNSRTGIAPKEASAPAAEPEEAAAQPEETAEEAPEAAEEPEEKEEEAAETTVRFDRVEKTDADPSPMASPATRPARKLSFEEKFGELKFGKNNPPC